MVHTLIKIYFLNEVSDGFNDMEGKFILLASKFNITGIDYQGIVRATLKPANILIEHKDGYVDKNG